MCQIIRQAVARFQPSHQLTSRPRLAGRRHGLLLLLSRALRCLAACLLPAPPAAVAVAGPKGDMEHSPGSGLRRSFQEIPEPVFAWGSERGNESASCEAQWLGGAARPCTQARAAGRTSKARPGLQHSGSRVIANASTAKHDRYKNPLRSEPPACGPSSAKQSSSKRGRVKAGELFPFFLLWLVLFFFPPWALTASVSVSAL